MLGRFIEKVVSHANYSSGIHRNYSNTRPLVCMHAVYRRTIGCRVRSKIPGMSVKVSAATVILAARSSSVSTTVSYTRSPDLTCLDFFLWGSWSSLCMKPLWKQKKTSSLELPSMLVPLWTCQKSSNGHNDQMSDDVQRSYRPMFAHSRSSCECHCCN